MLTYILRAGNVLVPNFTTYSIILEKINWWYQTLGKVFRKFKLHLKHWLPKNDKYSSVHRFEILPTLGGPDAVANLFKLT